VVRLLFILLDNEGAEPAAVKSLIIFTKWMDFTKVIAFQNGSRDTKWEGTRHMGMEMLS
jgi:hypothetical protein